MAQRVIAAGVSGENLNRAGIRDWVSVFKPRILVLLAVVAVVAGVVGSQGQTLWKEILLVAVAGVLASAGASLFNNLRDRDIDALMDRTRARPMANGRIGARAALVVAVALFAAGSSLALLVNTRAALLVVAGALIYAIVYTWGLKRRTPWNIVIGGLAGSCAVLAGWAAVSSDFGAEALLLAAVLVLWTPCHFWSFALVHQESYRKANVPMLPLVAGEKKTAGYILLHAILLSFVSLLLFVFSDLGLLYLAGATAFSAIFLAKSIHLAVRPERKIAWQHYKLSGFYLLGLFVSMLAATMI